MWLCGPTHLLNPNVAKFYTRSTSVKNNVAVSVLVRALALPTTPHVRKISFNPPTFAAQRKRHHSTVDEYGQRAAPHDNTSTDMHVHRHTSIWSVVGRLTRCSSSSSRLTNALFDTRHPMKLSINSITVIVTWHCTAATQRHVVHTFARLCTGNTSTGVWRLLTNNTSVLRQWRQEDSIRRLRNHAPGIEKGRSLEELRGNGPSEKNRPLK